jgi:hypothetical protein
MFGISPPHHSTELYHSDMRDSYQQPHPQRSAYGGIGYGLGGGSGGVMSMMGTPLVGPSGLGYGSGGGYGIPNGRPQPAPGMDANMGLVPLITCNQTPPFSYRLMPSFHEIQAMQPSLENLVGTR